MRPWNEWYRASIPTGDAFALSLLPPVVFVMRARRIGARTAVRTPRDAAVMRRASEIAGQMF